MAEPPAAPDDLDVAHDRESAVSTPRWVKVFGVIALLLVVLLVILLLVGGHGPGRHTGFGGQAPPDRSTRHDVQWP
jgi:hypothetical protein